jgi:hypothetical protein
MPRWDRFGSSLAFAALAAAGLPVAVTFAGAVIGSEAAVRLYAIAAAGLYAIGLCPDRSRRFAALASCAFAGMILALLPLGLRATAIGAAGLVAFTRGVLLPDSRNLRALAIEAVLGVAGFAAAGWFARGGLLALSLAVWGYFLVQSGYFLFGAHGRPAVGNADPFERARVRLQRLLEDDPV